MASGPARPANVGGSSDLLHVVNQSVREIHNRINQVEAAVPNIVKSQTLVSFPQVGANSVVDQVVNIQNITSNGVPSASPKASLGSTPFLWSVSIHKANQVTIRILNPTSSPATPNVVQWNIVVTMS